MPKEKGQKRRKAAKSSVTKRSKEERTDICANESHNEVPGDIRNPTERTTPKRRVYWDEGSKHTRKVGLRLVMTVDIQKSEDEEGDSERTGTTATLQVMFFRLSSSRFIELLECKF